MDRISNKFLDELFLLCFYKKDVVEIVTEHMKYEYVPDENREYKKILKSILSHYKNTNNLPTIGLVSQQHSVDIKVQDTLTKIRDTKVPNKEDCLNTFQEYIKRNKFVALNDKLRELYNSGNYDEAYKVQSTESEEIVNFTVKHGASYFSPVFSGFEKRIQEKIERKAAGIDKVKKIPLGIHPLDIVTYGGIDVTDTVLWILRSGIGKSTVMRWNGISAARKGHNVLHVQLEGSQKETEDRYDQIWTACLYNDIQRGNIQEKQYPKLQKIVKMMKSKKSDVYIHAFEQFNTASMVDIRNLIIDFEKTNGHVDEVIIDYLKYLHPGDGIKYGASVQDVKMRKENAADKIKNTAVEFGTRIITADQASDVPMEIWNDPKKVLTRHNISNAKNLPDSFSYVFTGNQTNDEKAENLIRIHVEKLRNYRLPGKPIKIISHFDRGRFFDYRATKDRFYDEKSEQYIY